MKTRVKPAKALHLPPIADIPFAIVVLTLLIFGLLMVYSTTGILAQEKFGDDLYYFKRQIVAAGIGVVVMLAASRVPISLISRVSPYLFFLAVAMLALPLIPGLGDRAGGAQRWIQLPGLRFQPGEIAKLLFVIFMAGYLARQEHRLERFGTGVIKPLLLISSVAVLYLLQPDFGSASVVLAVCFAMAAATGVRLRYMLAAGAIALTGLMTLVILSPYRMARVISFLSPWSDASGKGYQLIQSLIAVGSGGLVGKGLGESQQKLFFLPAAHTDFIFAVVSEELGFVGGFILIVGFLFLLWRGFSLARRFSHNAFAFSLAIGLTLLIVLPALLNVGVVTGMLPTKGLVLPLVGYGGSSLICSLLAAGLLLGIARDFQQHGGAAHE